MPKNKLLPELYKLRQNLIDIYLTYNDIIPEHIEKMHIKDCVDILSNIIKSYDKN